MVQMQEYLNLPRMYSIIDIHRMSNNFGYICTSPRPMHWPLFLFVFPHFIIILSADGTLLSDSVVAASTSMPCTFFQLCGTRIVTSLKNALLSVAVNNADEASMKRSCKEKKYHASISLRIFIVSAVLSISLKELVFILNSKKVASFKRSQIDEQLGLPYM